MTFQDLGLNGAILKALQAQGYSTPTPIQAGAIPPALTGRDVLGIAQTGTGKTCAFSTPILQRLNETFTKGPRHIRSLILTPTRELALQIQENIEQYGKNLPLRSAVIFGGVGQAPQVEKLRRGVDILVATPGRLLDLQGQGLLDLSKVEIFVLDEADRMLDMGFIHDVRRVLKLLPEKKQTLFFSATMPDEVQSLVNALLHDPARVTVTPVSSPVEVIDQTLYYVDKGNKTKLLAYLITEEQVKSALVFSRTKHGANKIAQDLNKAGITAAAIHGNKSQSARQQALGDFKAGKLKALVATDIAARGIDIEELSHVFQYNLPDVPETYVHRIGRTGRAGHEGKAICFCDISEKDDLKSVEKLLGKKIPVVEDHPWPMEILEVPPKGEKPGRGGSRSGRNAAKPAQNPPVQPSSASNPPASDSRADRLQQSRRKGKQNREKFSTSAVEETLNPSTSVEEHYRPDPFAGDVIMDATARLLAPRKPLQSPSKGDKKGANAPQSPRKGGKSPAQGGKNVTTPPRNDGKRTQSGGNTYIEGGQNDGGRGASRGKKALLELNVNSKSARAARASSEGNRNFEPKKPKQNRANSDKNGGFKKNSNQNRGNRGRRGPMEVTLRPSSQKDSTEQQSLMKPYYLND